MAKLISGAKITVETPTERYEFDAPTVGVSSTTMGRTHDLCIVDALNMVKTTLPTPKDTPVPNGSKTPESGLTNEQKFQLDAVINAAKGIERQKFMNARAIDAAIREAEKLTADAEHKFNMAVLGSLHTGLTSFTIDAKLEDTGFGELTEKTDYIGAMDTSMLYQTEV